MRGFGDDWGRRWRVGDRRFDGGGHGLLGRLIRPVVDRMSTWGLLHTMAATAFGIADRQDA